MTAWFAGWQTPPEPSPANSRPLLLNCTRLPFVGRGGAFDPGGEVPPRPRAPLSLDFCIQRGSGHATYRVVFAGLLPAIGSYYWSAALQLGVRPLRPNCSWQERHSSGLTTYTCLGATFDRDSGPAAVIRWRSTGPAFGHATRCFGHNSQTLDLLGEPSAFQVVGFSAHLPVVQGLPSKSAPMPDHSGMKLEGWIAVISLLLVLLLAQLGWR